MSKRTWSLRKGKDAMVCLNGVFNFLLKTVRSDECSISQHHYMIRVEVKKCKK